MNTKSWCAWCGLPIDMSMKALHPMRRALKKNQHARPSGLSRDVAGIE